MQNPIFRDPSASRRALRLGTASVLLTFSVASLLFSRAASAQKAPLTTPATAPVIGTGVTAVAPVAAKKSVNVLIVAMDDESTVVTAPPTTPAEVQTPLVTPPNATIAPDMPLTGVTPTRFEGLQPVWRALALKDKKPKPKPTPVLPLPEAPSNGTSFGGSIVGLGIPVTPDSALPGSNSNEANTAQTADSLPPSRPVAPPGRSLLAALPLARTLTGMGYTDAQATSLDGSILARAVGEKRLSTTTLTKLLEAMKSLDNATRLPEALRQTSINVATSRAKNAAVAVGQATGYRAVIAIYMAPFSDGNSTYTLVVSDSAKETGEPILWNEPARDEETARQTGATTGAALIDRALGGWASVGANNTKLLADAHLAKAREKVATDIDVAQDELLRVIALDPSRPDIASFRKTLSDARLAKAQEMATTDVAAAQKQMAQAVALDPTRADLYIVQGDLLSSTDAAGAAQAYRKASEINSKDGTLYEKIAVSYANAPVPDWPRALEAGKKALALGTDTVNVRLAMARAQFGRADLFRAANRAYKADDAETEAQAHIERALQLAPNNPDALRLLARSLLASGRTEEAVQVLGRVTTIFPKDAVLLEQYAQALVTVGDHKGDAFAAYSRLWRMTATTTPNVDPATYSLLMEGFDERVFSLGKTASQLSKSVADGNIARESAFLQLTRLKSDIGDAEMTINSLQVPAGYSETAATARQFAATLMNQSLEAHQNFLDSGQVVYRTRALDLYKQAVSQLNLARNGA